MSAALLFSVLLAAATAPPRCGTPDAAPDAVVGTMRTLPAAVRLALSHYLAPGGIADAGQRHDAIDVRHPGVPRHRFVRAERRGDAWVVRYESGGIAARWDSVTLVPAAAAGHPRRYVVLAADRCAAPLAAAASYR